MLSLLADVGLPMIGLYWPPAWVAFVPIVGIESWFAHRILKCGWGKATVAITLVNALSTLVGIPIVWILFTAIELRFFSTAIGVTNPASAAYAVTFQAGWLIPYENEFWWMIPTAALSLTVLFCLTSILIEWGLMVLLFRAVEKKTTLDLGLEE